MYVCVCVFNRSYVKMALSFTIESNIAVTIQKFMYYLRLFLGMTSLKQKREYRRFVDLRIILILHCGNEVLKQVLNFHFKLDGNVPRCGSTIKSFLLETVLFFMTEFELLYRSTIDSSDGN